jgi:hypothetical protein
MIAPRAEQRLGMISVPLQEYTTPYAPAEALLYGTVFSGLNQPYTPMQGAQSFGKQQSAQNMQKKR